MVTDLKSVGKGAARLTSFTDLPIKGNCFKSSVPLKTKVFPQRHPFLLKFGHQEDFM